MISIFGGSLGSDKINKTIEKNIDFIISQRCIYYMAMWKGTTLKDYKKYNSDSDLS